MNGDGLIKGDNLMVLFDIRSRNEPHELMHLEFEAATFLWNLRTKTFSLSNRHAMQLHEQSNSATYGKLLPVARDFFRIPESTTYRKSGLADVVLDGRAVAYVVSVAQGAYHD